MGARSRRVVVGALLGSVLVAVPTAAHAETVVTLDLSTVGHVKGSATTDAAYAYVTLVNDTHELIVPAVQPVVGGTVTFDEETWGLETDRTYTLRVSACADATTASCVPTDTSFTPTDVDPEVTWPQDRAIGPGETASVTVADPLGGGRLEARWGTAFGTTLTLVDGENALLMGEGLRTVSIRRCSILGCRSTGQGADFVVDTEFAPLYASRWQQPVHPDDSSAPDASVAFLLEAPAPVTLDWHLVDDVTQQTVPGVGGTIAGVVPHDNGQVTPFGLDLTGAPDGAYHLEGEMSYDVAGIGHRVASVAHFDDLVVDTVSPTIEVERVGPRSIYPKTDGYRDSFWVEFTASESGTYVTEALDADGDVVSSTRFVGLPTRTGWSGKTGSGGNRMVPVGEYTIRVQATDRAGNSTTVPLGSVQVFAERKVLDTVTRRVSARASELARWTGRCSSISKGGSRHLQGALGLMSNTRCASNTWRGSGVAVVHGLKVPNDWMKGAVSVKPIGGAALGHRGSLAVAEYWHNPGEWKSGWPLTSAFGLHPGNSIRDWSMPEEDRVVWRVATFLGHRYDVKGFKVVFEGTFLR